MKKYKIAFFSIGAALLIVNSSSAVEESIFVTATVPSWAVIEPSASYAQIILDGRKGSEEYNERLISLSLSHNSAIGYSLEVKSANDGKLVGVFDPSINIPYQISYDSKAPIVLTNEPQNMGGAVTSVTGSATTPFIKNIDIIISNDAANAATHQDYVDTITFTLTGI